MNRVKVYLSKASFYQFKIFFSAFEDFLHIKVLK